MTDLPSRLRFHGRFAAETSDDRVTRINGERETAATEIERLQEQCEDLQKTFDLMWAADMRAIKRWQAANPGNDLVWPDRSKLTEWLLNRITFLEALFTFEPGDALNSAPNDPVTKDAVVVTREHYTDLIQQRQDMKRALVASERKAP